MSKKLVTVDTEDVDKRAPIFIASFSNPPQKLDSLNFDVYGKHTDDDDPFAKRQRLVVAENSKIEYVGSHVTDLNCKYVVGVMSKKTGNIKVHPTTLMKFNTIVKAHKNIESSVIAEKGMLARNQLGQAFGTKKRKQAIKANEINQVNVSALSDVASTIKDSIQDNVTRQPVQEDLQLRSMNDKVIPPCNLAATFAKDVYHIDHIIPPQCMEVIDVSPLRKMRLLEECESFLQPWGAGSFIKSTLHAALSEKTDKKLLKKIMYLTYLCVFFKLTPRQKASSDLSERHLHGVSPVIGTMMQEMFLDIAGEGDMIEYKITSKTDDKVLAYIICLTLMLNNFICNTDQIASDLKIPISQVVRVAKELGCRIDIKRTKDKSDSNSRPGKKASLVLPLVFPVKTRGK
ncbi:RNA polymerase I associated factor, A49-like protein [Globomyces pollinis-pini]|nr:RNA polymerase I associated factor, A49-like protein [Globomyces pollinis-pini]